MIYISIGINIKNIRKNNNLTQEEMSEEIYCSVQALSKFERGLSIPDVNILKTISEKFNVDLNKIIYDENSFDIEEEIFNLCIKMLSNNEIPSIEKISYKTTVSIKRIKRLFKNDNNNLILFIIKSIDVSIKEELSKIKLQDRNLISIFVDNFLPYIISNKAVLKPLYENAYTNGIVINYLKESYSLYLISSLHLHDKFQARILLSIIMEIVNASLTYKDIEYNQLKTEIYLSLKGILI